MEFRFINRFNTKPKLKGYRNAKISYLRRIRWAVSLFYFSMGLTFSSWASRIPDIKTNLHLSEAELGTVLLAIPMGQLLAMPFSGRLATRFGSHKTLVLGLVFYAFSLTNIGLADTTWQLMAGLFVFGVFGNVSNISVNTQGVYTEALYKRTIMSSFHGMWSFAGFTGALTGLLMMSLKLSPYTHFVIVAAIVVIFISLNFRFLVKAKASTKVEKRRFFAKPDSLLIWLGLIAFCCMASEGVMFDWSGVYFKEIVKAPESLVVLGYASFMIMMASGRFLGDRLVQRYGAKLVLQISGCLISVGLFSAVAFPYLVPATLAFMLVGIGVSTVVPTIYSLAGKNATIPPGEALTVVSGVSFFGFLMGPPMIGYVAEAFGLQFSFAFIGCFGILIAFLVYRIKHIL